MRKKLKLIKYEEYDLDFNWEFFSILLIISNLLFLFLLSSLNKGLGEHFFPLGLLFIFDIVSLVIVVMFGLIRNEWWEEE